MSSLRWYSQLPDATVSLPGCIIGFRGQRTLNRRVIARRRRRHWRRRVWAATSVEKGKILNKYIIILIILAYIYLTFDCWVQTTDLHHECISKTEKEMWVHRAHLSGGDSACNARNCSSARLNFNLSSLRSCRSSETLNSGLDCGSKSGDVAPHVEHFWK